MTANAPIDFEKEAKEIAWSDADELSELTDSIEKFGRSIAERVEAQTIERCGCKAVNVDLSSIPRLYGPKSSKEE